MAFRSRQKLKSGCDTCRLRRKKCNEAKPSCSDCQRLNLSCSWDLAHGPKSRQKRRRYNPTYQVHLSLFQSAIGGSDGIVLHTYDQCSSQISSSSANTNLLDCDHVIDSFETAHGLPALHTKFSVALDAHIIIVALDRGWDTVRKSILIDPQWERLAQVDRETEYAGYSLVRRLMALWEFRVVTKYYAAIKANWNLPPFLLPRWLEPLYCQNTTPHPAVIDFFPWPSMRERLIYGQNKYINDRFIRDYMINGYRSACSLTFDESYVRDPSTNMFAFSTRFLNQVYDLGTWCLSKDFLERYPEFRGDAAQYEPSPTVYRLEYLGKEYKQRREYRDSDREYDLFTPFAVIPIGRPQITREKGRIIA